MAGPRSLPVDLIGSANPDNRNHSEAESCVERSPAKSRGAFDLPRDFGKSGSAVSNRSQAFRTRSLWRAEPAGAESEESRRETGHERPAASPELPLTQTKFATVLPAISRHCAGNCKGRKNGSFERVGGGPGRTRTCNQTVMSGRL
jgi:hypothetical protein